MRKIIGFTLALAAFVVIFSACSSSETYADKLKNESKAIDRFVKERELNVLKSMPEDYKFGENDYYKDEDSGIYLRIISRGDTEKMASKDKLPLVLFRYYGTLRFSTADTTKYSNNGNLDPISFTYGNSNTYTDYYSSNYSYSFLSPACAFPLDYVGEGGEVSMIVPFANGSAMQQSSYEPLFYGRIKYTKIIQQ